MSYLTWDSDFFGYPVHKIMLSPLSTVDGVIQLLNNLLENEARLVVLTSSHQPQELALEGFHVGVKTRKITLATTLNSGNSQGCSSFSQIKPYFSKGPVDSSLISLAIQAGVYSRFKLDPNITAAQFISLYQQWISKCVSGVLADVVLVYRHDFKIIGFVALKIDPNLSLTTVVLLAVDSFHRGKGVGKSLLIASFEWACRHGSRQIKVSTQSDNIKGLSLYKSLGFEVIDSLYEYHIWSAL